MLGVVEGTNGRDNKGILKGVNQNVKEVGGLPIRISIRVTIVALYTTRFAQVHTADGLQTNRGVMVSVFLFKHYRLSQSNVFQVQA